MLHKNEACSEKCTHFRHDWLLLVPVDGYGGGVDPGGGAQVPEADVRVPRHQGVCPAGQGGGVQLEEGGQVVGVGHRHQVVDGAPARVTQLVPHHVLAVVIVVVNLQYLM